MWPKANSWTALHLLRTWTSFNVYAMWRHHFLSRSQASEEELEEFKEALKLCREDFIQHAQPGTWMADHGSMPHLRSRLCDLGDCPHVERMSDHEVVCAVIDELERDQLMLCPDRDDVPKYIERARARRAAWNALYQRPPARFEPISLADAQPFTDQPSPLADDPTGLAARGVSGAQEARCYAQYERDMDECRAYRLAMGGSRFMDACAQRAFFNYQQCRGY